MSIDRTPFRGSRLEAARAIGRRLAPAAAALVVFSLVACGDSSGPGGDTTDRATLSGIVRTAGAGAAIEGATISIGERRATSDASGSFELTDLPVGSVKVHAERPGYLPAEATVALGAGANTHDFALALQEIFESGANAVYVPAGVGPMRGAIIVLGGPDASGFVTGGRIAPADNPDLELSLQGLGAGLRGVARSAHVALLGSSITGMASTKASDAALFAALGAVGELSGHPELADVPVLMFGLSAGAHEAAALASRSPARAVGLLVRVPVSVTALTDPAALAVPTFVMQAELDQVADNTFVRITFEGNRSRGGLWALAVEPGVGHSEASAEGNSAALGWIIRVLALRLPAAAGDPLVALDQATGWLGNQTTLDIAPWADYPDDRAAASWLLSESEATSWQVLGTEDGDGEAAVR